MAGPRLLALQKQFDDLLSAKTKIENTATSANRDLTDSENADIDGLLSRAEQLKPEIERQEADLYMNPRRVR